jgi:oxygen-independent coproporphyrinogen III oxidase
LIQIKAFESLRARCRITTDISEADVEADLICKFAAPAPRYTSYPTAPHFHDGIGSATYAEWMSALGPGTAVSLYVHIPYCHTLCWFCGCHTRATRTYAPVAWYLRALQEEIALLGKMLPAGTTVRRIHWGGGSPSILTPEDVGSLDTALRSSFNISTDAEFSVEIDPRSVSSAQIRAFAGAGLTRASVGVQDFDEKVQKAINRLQSFAVTRAVIDSLRLTGVGSLSVDVLYGLPHQRLRTLIGTLLKVRALDPDRIALFGYAHVPWMKKNQALIDATALPGPEARLEQVQLAAELITSWGYERIGIDHFARPGDSLAVAAQAGHLRRNFQGYTDDDCEVLIGVGASAISRLPQGYVQNAAAASDYQRSLRDGLLPIARGIALRSEDRLRAYAIERLMCDFRLSGSDLRKHYGEAARKLMDEIESIAATDARGIVAHDGETVWITERGRPFVRSICAALDPYFVAGATHHSTAI